MSEINQCQGTGYLANTKLPFVYVSFHLIPNIDILIPMPNQPCMCQDQETNTNRQTHLLISIDFRWCGVLNHQHWIPYALIRRQREQQEMEHRTSIYCESFIWDNKMLCMQPPIAIPSYRVTRRIVSNTYNNVEAGSM